MMALWVVEVDEGGSWKPCLGCALSREDGRSELKDWKLVSPDDKFRLTEYGPKT